MYFPSLCNHDGYLHKTSVWTRKLVFPQIASCNQKEGHTWYRQHSLPQDRFWCKGHSWSSGVSSPSPCSHCDQSLAPFFWLSTGWTCAPPPGRRKPSAAAPEWELSGGPGRWKGSRGQCGLDLDVDLFGGAELDAYCILFGLECTVTAEWNISLLKVYNL